MLELALAHVFVLALALGALLHTSGRHLFTSIVWLVAFAARSSTPPRRVVKVSDLTGQIWQTLCEREHLGEQITLGLESLQQRLRLRTQLGLAPGTRGALDLPPVQWRRDRGSLTRAQRVHAHGRLVGIVLAPVDQHPSSSQALGHARDHQIGVLALEQLGDGTRERLGLLI